MNGADMLSAVFDTFIAAERAAELLRTSETPVITGPIGKRIGESVTSGLIDAITHKLPYKCEHLELPDVAFARAARPGQIACQACNATDMTARGEFDGPIVCDGCGRMSADPMRLAARKGWVIIATALCRDCLIGETFTMLNDAIDEQAKSDDGGSHHGCDGQH